jgi:hypothetical protein
MRIREMEYLRYLTHAQPSQTARTSLSPSPHQGQLFSSALLSPDSLLFFSESLSLLLLNLSYALFHHHFPPLYFDIPKADFVLTFSFLFNLFSKYFSDEEPAEVEAEPVRVEESLLSGFFFAVFDQMQGKE